MKALLIITITLGIFNAHAGFNGIYCSGNTDEGKFQLNISLSPRSGNQAWSLN